MHKLRQLGLPLEKHACAKQGGLESKEKLRYNISCVLKRTKSMRGQFMRLRNIPTAIPKLEESPHYVKAPFLYKGKWSELFGNENPIHIEIGMGKGQFILNKAIRNPNINYIGIEKYTSVLVRAVEKRQASEHEGITNLYYMAKDAKMLTEIFQENEVSKIYLNFSDPWPKAKHWKRRLTALPFLKIYEHILKEESLLEFKTDNPLLFDFSIEQIREAGWGVIGITKKLYEEDAFLIDNIPTEYENKFAQEGKPICKVIARYEKGEEDV